MITYHLVIALQSLYSFCFCFCFVLLFFSTFFVLRLAIWPYISAFLYFYASTKYLKFIYMTVHVSIEVDEESVWEESYITPYGFMISVFSSGSNCPG